MEDGFPLFDPNDESARQEQKLREYYEEFSANCRRRLFSKNIIRPTSVYDVLYPQIRNNLVSKNVSFDTNLEESAKLIRDNMIAKIIVDETNLDKISEDFRKSMLAREKIQEDRNKLLRASDSFRDTNISKNNLKDTSLEKDSIISRENNVSKNKVNPSIFKNVEDDNKKYQELNKSKNISKDQDLLRDSIEYRDDGVRKNTTNNYDIEKNSDELRESNLRKNIPNKNDIDDNLNHYRENQVSKNRKKDYDLEEGSKTYRVDDLSKNKPKEQDLLRDSDGLRNRFRTTDINKNVDKKTNIDVDSYIFRKNNLRNNLNKTSDLDIQSAVYREGDLSKNTQNESNLEEDSTLFREDDLSKNKEKTFDLERDSNVFREDDLSKNNIKNSDLEKSSQEFRNDSLSKNKEKIFDLDKQSAVFREDDLSKNTQNSSNLEEDSDLFRNDSLSKNKEKTSDLDKQSIVFREDSLSKNKEKIYDLENDSNVFREDDLSKNTQNESNLEEDSTLFREDDLSKNISINSNLEEDSVVFREGDTSLNNPIDSDLANDSTSFRGDDLSKNIPINSDLANDSTSFRSDDLSKNNPINSDIISDSTPFLYNNLSSNTPNNNDLLTDSVPFRNDDLAANTPSNSDLLTDSVPFRNDDLAANTPSNSDLLTDSVPFRNDDLASNVSINSNLSSNSASYRDNALSKNKPSNSNLLLDSISYRKNAVSKNDIFGLLGVTVQGAGTSSFLGISRVFTQGILIRQLLKSKNKPKNSNVLLDSEVYRENNKIKNKWIFNNNEYTSTNENWILGKISQGKAGGNLVDYSPLEPYTSPTVKSISSTEDYVITKGNEIQSFYGTSMSVDFPTGRINREVNDALYSVNSKLSKGGEFLDYSFKRQTYTPFKEGIVTSTIRNYNQERNAFNLRGLQPGDPNTLGVLNGLNQDGFQDLIEKTIGSFDNVAQLRTITTPASIIQANGGAYYNGGNYDSDILRPEGKGAKLGSAESMMGKTVAGNPFDDDDFFTGKRGVKHIVNVIKSSNQKLAQNFDPQNSNSYIIGSNRDGSDKKSRQRYTIANPYAPGKAGKLLFSIKNYASGDQYFFPPYIESIQNTDDASWNSVNFLGRPEATYTYNNSSRSASINFFVLTDYAESVDIGRDWKSDNMEKIVAKFSKHFTSYDKAQNDARKLQQEELRKLKKQLEKQVSEIDEKLNNAAIEQSTLGESDKELDISSTSIENVSDNIQKQKTQERLKDEQLNSEVENNSSDSDSLNQEKEDILKEISKTSEAISDAINTLNKETNYSESNNTSGNIYNINITKNEYNGTEIISKPEDTINRIETMKAGLMFQPAYFSGDKIDFVRKVEFLSKLTRPAAASEGSNSSGFSFTKPPVCHIRLGDWWNHDIIVNSVSFDYADSPWTLDGDRVQPMWVSVSINFNIIGPYGSSTGRPPLATDEGGMYSPIINS